MCLSAIYWARLGKIYYANTKKDAAAINFDDDFIYQEIPKPYPQRSIPLVPLMREEALQIFKIWGHKVDKIPY
jgi:tRNA(Arg) A34 adenosine deaminase TadA